MLALLPIAYVQMGQVPRALVLDDMVVLRAAIWKAKP